MSTRMSTPLLPPPPVSTASTALGEPPAVWHAQKREISERLVKIGAQSDLDDLHMSYTPGTVAPAAVREFKDTICLERARLRSFETQHTSAEAAEQTSPPPRAPNKPLKTVAPPKDRVAAVHGCNILAAVVLAAPGSAANGWDGVYGIVSAAEREPVGPTPLGLAEPIVQEQDKSTWSVVKHVRRDSLTFEIVEEECQEVCVFFLILHIFYTYI